MIDLLTQQLRSLRHQTELLEAFDWDEERMNKALDIAIEQLNAYEAEDFKGLIPYFKAAMADLGYFDIEVSLLLKVLSLSAADQVAEV
jgi:hypothetical protein